MSVKVPFLHGKRREIFKRCVDRAAEETGYADHQVIVMMTAFLEAIADEVAKGRAVSIPGFGMFVQQGFTYRGRTFWRPGFIGAKSFRTQVRLGTQPTPETLQVRKNYRENNTGSLKAKDNGDRTFTVMSRIRNAISHQLQC